MNMNDLDFVAECALIVLGSVIGIITVIMAGWLGWLVVKARPLEMLDSWLWRQEVKKREAYLAEAVDLADLEARIRKQERFDR